MEDSQRNLRTVRIGLVIVLALLCYRAVSPFLTLLIWSLILAVALYPLKDAVARKVGGRHGLAATLIAILGLALIVAPSAVLMSSLGDSVHQFIQGVQSNSLEIPAPSESVATWPVVGPQLHAMWSQAHADLPALVQSLQPQLGDIAKSVLGFVGGIGVGLLQFLAAFIIAGIIMPCASLTTRIKSWMCWSPTGITMRPPGASCSISGCGIFSTACARMGSRI